MSNQEIADDIARLKADGAKLLNLSIEPKGGEWNLYQWYIPSRSSVLAGTEQKRWLESYPTKAEAQKAFPKAEVYDSFAPPDQLPKEPPSGYYGSEGGFYDAGEYWSENDY